MKAVDILLFDALALAERHERQAFETAEDLRSRVSAAILASEIETEEQHLESFLRSFACGGDDLLLFRLLYDHGRRSVRDLLVSEICLHRDLGLLFYDLPRRDLWLLLLLLCRLDHRSG